MLLVVVGYWGIITEEIREIRETEIAVFQFAVCQTERLRQLFASAEIAQRFFSVNHDVFS